MTKVKNHSLLLMETCITSDGVVMVDSAALAELLGIAREFDRGVKTLSFKANTQRNGALEIKEVTVELTSYRRKRAVCGRRQA